ncbi:hypothetical protein [Nocardia sp. NPDC050412]|uniref:hypothetical protein n=1 Tax=Nocardia sp. NPDC050412 TaxID=3364320 RepID=UPI003794A086
MPTDHGDGKLNVREMPMSVHISGGMCGPGTTAVPPIELPAHVFGNVHQGRAV